MAAYRRGMKKPTVTRTTEGLPDGYASALTEPKEAE